MAEYRLKFNGANDLIKDKFVIVTGEDGVRYSGSTPVSQNELMCSDRTLTKTPCFAHVLKGMVVGRATGNMVDKTFEVRLFNPIWQPDGSPAYYYMCDPLSFACVSEAEVKAVPRLVFKDFKPRTNTGVSAFFPHCDIGYKTVCYDQNFDAIGHWNRADEWFGTKDWYATYVQKYMSVASTDPNKNPKNFPYFGDNYDPTPSPRIYFEPLSELPAAQGFLPTITAVSKAAIAFRYDMFWMNDYIAEAGICSSTVNNLPTIDDTRHPNEAGWYYRYEKYILTLAATNYYLRQYAILANGNVVYGSTVNVTTPAVGNKPFCDHINIPNNGLGSNFVTLQMFTAGHGSAGDGDSMIHTYGIKVGKSLATMVDVPVDDAGIAQAAHYYFIQAKLTNLEPNTRYYIKGYLINSDGETEVTNYTMWLPDPNNPNSKTEQLITTGYFTTPATSTIPRVISGNASDLTAETATLNGRLINDGGAALMKYGFCWSDTKSTPTIADYNTLIMGAPVAADGKFTHDLTGLKKNTRYYVRAWAYNVKGYAYSEVVQFNTGGITIETQSAKAVSKDLALVTAVISSAVNYDITMRGICWNTAGMPTIADNKTENGTGVGTFAGALSGLTPATTIYARAYATHAGGTVYGNTVNVTTLKDSAAAPGAPLVSTIVPNVVAPDFVIGSFKIVDEGASAVSAQGIGISLTNTPATLEDFVYTQESSENTPVNLANLTPETDYYLIAYAENATNLGLGNAVPFRTPAAVEAEPFAVSHTIVVNQATKLCTVTVITPLAMAITYWGCWATEVRESLNNYNSPEISATSNVLSFTLKEGTTFVKSWAWNAAGELAFSTVQEVQLTGAVAPDTITPPEPEPDPYTNPESNAGLFVLPANPYVGQTKTHGRKQWTYYATGWKRTDVSAMDSAAGGKGGMSAIPENAPIETNTLFDVINPLAMKVVSKEYYSDMETVDFWLRLYFDEPVIFEDGALVDLTVGTLKFTNLHQNTDVNNNNVMIVAFPHTSESPLTTRSADITAIMESSDDLIVTLISATQVKMISPKNDINALQIESIRRPARKNVNFIFEGNSRTSTMRFHAEGTVGFENQFPAYPEQLMKLPNFKDRGNFYNVAVWGTGNDTVFGRYNANIKPHRPEANGGEAGITEAYIFIMTGIIDIIINRTNVDTLIANYKAYCATAKADGFKVVVLGEFYGLITYSDAAELDRLKYNNAMMDYAREGGIHMFIDTDHLIGTNMTDILHADTSFHLTTKGKKLIADYVNFRFNVGTYNQSDAYKPYVTMVDLNTKANKSLFTYAISNYADNAAAKAAGLTAGMYYRTGDVSKVVW